MNADFYNAVRSRLADGKLSQSQVNAFEAIDAAWAKYGDGDNRKLAYVLATAWHETGRFKWLKEIWGPTAAQKRYEGRADLGNTVAGDGARFMGRGLVQITGRRNYTDWGRRLGLDLLKEPQLAEHLDVAARILVEGMMKGTFTGLKLADYIGAKADYKEARRVVNGTDKASLIAGYAVKFESALGDVVVQPAPPTARSPIAAIVAVIIAIVGGAYAFLKSQGILP